MLSLYDFDRSTTSISSDMFVNGIHIRNLKFSNTQLTMLKDNSLQYLRTTLETLAITSSKLNQVSKEERLLLFFVCLSIDRHQNMADGKAITFYYGFWGKFIFICALCALCCMWKRKRS